MKIIEICGPPCSGKTYVHDFLIKNCNFLGGKLIGAGGGGFLLMLTKNKKKTIELLKKNNINYLNFKIEDMGSRILKDL